MKLIIGLVVKGGKEFISRWIESIERMRCKFLVVDNGADKIVREKLINHPQMQQYHIQKFPNRNQSRDYQKILEMAREEKAEWCWNIDIDEVVPNINIDELYFNLLNTINVSIGFPLIEMRNDDKHYVMIKESNGELRDGRLVHKLYKVLSHFEFDKNDIHGCSIPHNCPRQKDYTNIIIQHFGHISVKLREEKREREGHSKDKDENMQTWLEEDESKITIKPWEELEKKWQTEKHQ